MERAAQEKWQKEMDQAEELRRKMEERRRQEIDEIRRAEADQRKSRERERNMREEEARRDANERQKLLDSIERSLVELLERLNLLEELALPLAKRNIFDLEKLLKTPRWQLVETMESSGVAMDGLDQVVVAARRSVALERISYIQLPEDAEWEEKAALKKKAEMESEEDRDTRAHAGYAGYRNRNKNDEQTPEELADQQKVMDAKAKAEKPPIGPMRTALVGVVDRWYDYLACVPVLSEQLTRDAANEDTEEVEADVEDEKDDEDESEAKKTPKARPRGPIIGPTWKHTCAWALWMLTSSKSTTAKGERMTRAQIESQLEMAKDYVWQALYPSMKYVSKAEWRIYWQRVWKSFAGFFTERCTAQWKIVAAADARTAAVLAGKGEAEQAAAAAQAERLVVAMLKQRPQRPRSSSPAVRPSSPALPVRRPSIASPPSGMAASFHLFHKRSMLAAEAVKAKPVAEDPTDPPDANSATSPSQSRTWPTPHSPALAAAAAMTERYKQTPSRYLESISSPSRMRRGPSPFEAGARYCPVPNKKHTPRESGASTSRGRRPVQPASARQRPRTASGSTTFRQQGSTTFRQQGSTTFRQRGKSK